MQKKIDINIVLNSITALSKKKLDDSSIWLMDNSIYKGEGKGTAKLVTACAAGQVLRWKITAVDLQAPASIKSIYFLGSTTQQKPEQRALFDPVTNEFIDPDLNLWSGIVPLTMVEGVEYKYRLEVQVGEGKNSLMYIDSPAIKRINPYLSNSYD